MNFAQDELADVAGISRTYLAQIETGRFFVSLKIFGNLATALGAELAEFLRQPEPRAMGSGSDR